MAEVTWLERASKLELLVRNRIDGRAEGVGGARALPKRSPRDGRVLYEVGEGDPADVDRAVVAARRAYADRRWAGSPVNQRKRVLLKMAELIEARSDEFALLDCVDVGKPITNALGEDVPAAIGLLREAAEVADKLFTRMSVDGPAPNMGYQVRRPVGVVGAIVGWNYPLALAAMKVAPALAVGNSVVLKPSEFTSLCAGKLAEVAMEAGLPEGVFNVVHGAGAIVGEALARHRDVGLIAFTGSTATGKQIMSSAAQSNMKRLMLECGGKSPYICFEDCAEHLDFVAQHIVQMAFPNQGERCAACTRLLVHEGVQERLIGKVIEYAGKIRAADPLEPATSFGALIHQAHLDKVTNYIALGRTEGAVVVHQGKRVEPVKGGYYLEPTVFSGVKPNHRIAREEIFGPVLAVLSFKTDDEAIALANDSPYALAGFVWTTNLGRAQRLAQRLHSGQLFIVGTASPSPGWINLGVDPQKESGFGLEGGLDGLASYTTMNSVYVLI